MISCLDKKLLRDLQRLWGQSLAIALVIGAGVATVVLSMGTYQSLSETREVYYERYRLPHVFAFVKRAPETLTERISQIPGVARLQTRIVESVLLDIPKIDEPVRGQIVSLPETHEPALNNLAVSQGRWIEPDNPDEIMINEAFAEAHNFHPGNTITATINGNKRTLKIVGIALSPEFVYVIGPGDLFPDNKRFGIIWMGETALEAAYDLKEAFNDLSLTLTRDAVQADVIDQLDTILEPYGGTGAYGREDQVSDTFVRSELAQLKNMATILPPIFLGVAAFLFNVVIKRTIDTEREQIGLLKAFGYTNLDVGWHYMKFVLAITMLGAVIGLSAGVWLGRGLTEMYTEYYRFPLLYYKLSAAVLFGAVSVAMMSSGLGALQAIASAVNLAPAVAMQPAPPTLYHASPLEKLGALKALSVTSRMIIRHVTRWPVRASLTILGMAFACALLVMSNFFMDSVNEMINSFFFRTQRQDVTLQFADERNASIKHELAHLPGVLQTEIRRSVAVRLTHRYRSERAAIIGIDPNSDLSGLNDSEGLPVNLPPTGLILSDKMAELLDTRTGDIIDVEVMEGKRPHTSIPVTLVVTEYIGTMVYMNRAALHALMQEAPSGNTAYLKVDALKTSKLYKDLKQKPIVTSVSLKAAALETFQTMLNETFVMMVTIYIAFASIITIGVVYNSARISLAERARELASLRVMGFYKREVAYILLGELGWLVLCALPLGAAIGYSLAFFIATKFSTDLYRLPLVLEHSTIGLAVSVVLLCAAATALVVARRISHLDLVSVLKTRE